MKDFNNVKDDGFELIPDGTQVLVQLEFKHDDFDGLEHTSKNGAKYYKYVLRVMSGEFTNREIYGMFPIDGKGAGEDWIRISEQTAKQMINSNACLEIKDTSPRASKIRQLENGYLTFQGCMFVATVGIEKSKAGYNDKNNIKKFITGDNPSLHKMHMGSKIESEKSITINRLDSEPQPAQPAQEQVSEPEVVEDEIPF